MTVALPRHAVKICGLREPAHARVAALAGADLLGFIFAPARRRVTIEVAAACVAEARAAAGGRRILAVGVFVDAGVEEMNGVAAAAGLDLLQLHGEERPDILARLVQPVIKGLRPRPGTTVAAVEALIAPYAAAQRAPIAYLVDGYHPSHQGGQGVRADWDLVSEVATRWPVVLAGGLDASNVGHAIERAKPWVVDVSSGVETAGVKDAAKIASYVATAKRAFAESPIRALARPIEPSARR